MKFETIRDDNGATLQSLAELLAEKAKAAGLVTIFVFVAKDGPNKGIHVMSTIAGSVSNAMIRLGQEMQEEPAETQTIPMVSPEKMN